MKRWATQVAAIALGLAALTIPTHVPAQGAPPAGAGAKADGRQPLTVDADRMERLGKESLVIFTGNVVARHDNSVQYADRSVSTGGVRVITRDCRTATATRAEYLDLEQRVVLIGNARVWQDDNVVSGDTITIDLSQDRSVVQGGKQERVKAVFYPRGDGKKDDGGRRSGEPCTN